MVPVNGVTSYPYDSVALQERLNDIFNLALVDVLVEFLPGITLDWFDGQLSDLSSTTSETPAKEIASPTKFAQLIFSL